MVIVLRTGVMCPRSCAGGREHCAGYGKIKVDVGTGVTVGGGGRSTGTFVRDFADVLRGRPTGTFGPFSSRCECGCRIVVRCGLFLHYWITVLWRLRADPGGKCQFGDGMCGWEGDSEVTLFFRVCCPCLAGGGFGFGLPLHFGLGGVLVFFGGRGLVARVDGPGCDLRSTLGRGK